MPWAVAAAGVSAAAGLAGSAMQSGAVSGAAGKANAAQEAALAQARADLEPWRTTGGLANTASSDLLGLNGQAAADAAMGNYQRSPGYEWQMSEGLRGVDAGAAARGMARSGATIKGELAFSQGLADSDFSAYYNRLADMSKLGESAASGSADASQKTGAGIAQTDVSAGKQQASIYGDAASGLSTAANGLFSNPTFTDWLGGSSGNPGGFGSQGVGYRGY